MQTLKLSFELKLKRKNSFVKTWLHLASSNATFVMLGCHVHSTQRNVLGMTCWHFGLFRWHHQFLIDNSSVSSMTRLSDWRAITLMWQDCCVCNPIFFLWRPHYNNKFNSSILLKLTFRKSLPHFPGWGSILTHAAQASKIVSTMLHNLPMVMSCNCRPFCLFFLLRRIESVHCNNNLSTIFCCNNSFCTHAFLSSVTFHSSCQMIEMVLDKKASVLILPLMCLKHECDLLHASSGIVVKGFCLDNEWLIEQKHHDVSWRQMK